VLESIPYFQVFWRDCEAIRLEFDVLKRKYSEDQNLAAASAKEETPNVQKRFDLKQEDVKRRTIYHLTLKVANILIRSTPHLRQVLARLDYNVAHFVLFIQFVLSCLHQVSHLYEGVDENTAATIAELKLLPICSDRTEEPFEGGSAVQAKLRLQALVDLFDSPFTASFVVLDRAEITKFDPRSDFAIRGELESISHELRETKTIVSALQGEAAQKEALQDQLAKIKAVRDSSPAMLAKTSFGNVEIHSFASWLTRLDEVLNSK
jgi:hypothetical protein